MLTSSPFPHNTGCKKSLAEGVLLVHHLHRAPCCHHGTLETLCQCKALLVHTHTLRWWGWCGTKWHNTQASPSQNRQQKWGTPSWGGWRSCHSSASWGGWRSCHSSASWGGWRSCHSSASWGGWRSCHSSASWGGWRSWSSTSWTLTWDGKLQLLSPVAVMYTSVAMLMPVSNFQEVAVCKEVRNTHSSLQTHFSAPLSHFPPLPFWTSCPQLQEEKQKCIAGSPLITTTNQWEVMRRRVVPVYT